MDVLALFEGADQAGVAGQVGHDAQFDLGIVERHDRAPRRRDEGAADAAAVLAADRDVLQVRVAGGQPSGGGAALVVAGVHPAGVRVDHFHQLFGVGAAQLGQRAVVQDQARQLVLVGDGFQRVLVGGGLALRGFHYDRQVQLLEQQRLQLLGRVQVELAPGDLEGAGLDRQHPRGQVAALAAQFVGVDQHAVFLDPGQHLDQRHFDLVVDLQQRRLGGEFFSQHLVQAQADVGVLGGVARGGFDIHLRERNLLGALAGDVLVTQRAVAQIAQRQRIQVVAGGGRVQHEALQQGVLCIAADPHAVTAHHVEIVFAVLAELGLGCILQHRAQRIQHLFAWQLGRCAGVVVRQRHVSGAAGFNRKTQADQIGAHRIERVGFGVEGDQLGAAQAFDPAGQRVGIQNGFVFTRCRQGRIQPVFGCGRCADVAAAAYLARFGQCIAGAIARRRGLHVIAIAIGGAQFAQRLVEAVAGVERTQGVGVAFAQGEIVRVLRQWHIEADCHQFAVQRQAWQGGTQVVADLALDLVGLFDHRVQRAELVQPFGGGLGAALFHTGHVVDGVTHQRQIIDDAFGWHAELFLDIGRARGAAAAHGVDQRNAGPHQLREILVRGGDFDLDAVLLRRHRQGADHIVGFDPGFAQDRQPERFDNGQHRFHLGTQVVRHRWPVGLVVRIQLVTEGGAGGVDDEGGVVGFFLQRGAQHVDHAEQRAGG